VQHKVIRKKAEVAAANKTKHTGKSCLAVEIKNPDEVK